MATHSIALYIEDHHIGSGVVLDGEAEFEYDSRHFREDDTDFRLTSLFLPRMDGFLDAKSEGFGGAVFEKAAEALHEDDWIRAKVFEHWQDNCAPVRRVA